MLLSPSALNQYRSCPKSYEYYKVRKVPGMISKFQYALSFGSIVHKIVETYYRNIRSNLTPNLIKLNVYSSAKKVVDFNGLSKQDREKLERHLKVFGEFESKRISQGFKIKPLKIEADIKRSKVHAIIDAMFEKKDGTKVVYDWKTGYGWYPQLDEGLMIQGAIQKYVTGADEMAFVFLQSGIILDLPEEVNLELIKPFYFGIKNKSFPRNRSDNCNNCPFNIICDIEEQKIRRYLLA